jgi:integrase
VTSNLVQLLGAGQGNELQVRFLVREFCEALDRAGVPDFRFHDLRHTFATRMVQRGIDLYKVQPILGHKTGLMTDGMPIIHRRVCERA